MAKSAGTKTKKPGTKTGSRSGTAKKSPAKSSTASRKKPNIEIIDEPRLKAQKQITAILLFAFSVFFLFVTIIPGESFWQVMRNVIFGLFGYCAFLWPLIMIYVSVMYAMEKTDDKIGFKMFEITMLIVFICGAFYIFSGNFDNVSIWEDIKDSYKMGISHANGGVFGAIFGGILMMVFGKTGAAITDIIIICVMIMLITGTTLIKLFKTLWTPVKKIEEYSEVKVNEMIPVRGKRFNIDVDLGPDDETEVRRKSNDDDDDEILTIFDQDSRSKNRTGKRAKKNSEDEAIAKIFDINREEKKAVSAPETVSQPQSAVQNPASGIDDIVKKAAQKSAAAKAPVPVEIASEIKAQSGKDDNSANYQFPPLDCLRKGTKSSSSVDSEELKQNASTLVSTLKSFGVETKVIDISRGPSVTRYELKPSAGVKISRITNLADDIALNLAASGVRIEAPIPNKAAVGIEIPNRNREVVTAREIIDTNQFRLAKSKLNVALGKDITGNVTCADLSKMPHLLIAGTTGSGKSVCVNSMIISILYNARPDEVKLLMIDPKKVEFTVYNGIPHLLVPVVTDPRKASGALNWAVSEMLNRYKLFSQANVRDMKGYNKLCENTPDMKKLPHIVIFIDELSDLMMAAPNEVEDSICRLAQMARAAGMHLVIATQRPSVDVITGLIKANIPSRIALTVSSQIDSRTILDSAGAEKLLGNGDMLFNPIGAAKPIRVQGCFLTDEEVESVVDFIKSQESANYDEEVNEEIERQAAADTSKKKGGSSDFTEGGEEEDEMLSKAIEVVVEAQMASTTLLQRKLRLGYARAARLVDTLEERGIVGPFEGSKPRKVLMTKQQWMEMNALASDSDNTSEE